MKQESLRKLVVGPLFALLLTALLATQATAQEPPKKPVVQPPGKSAETEPQKAKKFRGRLPAYYGKVVSEKQREEIYGIQAKFNEEIAKLKEQLVELTTKRDTEVENVLTDEQRAEIAKLKDARKSRSSSGSDATSSGSSQ